MSAAPTLHLAIVAEQRPTWTRADCRRGGRLHVRPCPMRDCRYHLGDSAARHRTPTKTCALDMAERGGATLDEIAKVLAMTRERVRQIESKALTRLRAECERRGIALDDLISSWRERRG